MTQEKREKPGAKTNTSSTAKSKTADQRAKKNRSATLLYILDTEEELSQCQLDVVPLDVRAWLTGTFTNDTKICKMKHEDKAKPRVITQAVQTSSHIIRRFRTSTSSAGIAYPAEVVAAFKDVDQWSFDVFALNQVSQGQSLKYVICEMFNKYDLVSRFQIPLTTLISFAEALEVGYGKYQNPYHNAIHAADVTQTVHTILLHTGSMHWFNDLEILAIFFSTSVHDYEHTGTTNSFHIQTRSEVALLYNDTSVLENHHLSAAYQLLQKPELNILDNLMPHEWREMRQMVIKMVLATDMSSHFQDMKNTLRGLRQHERLDKCIVMSTILHVADISHPAKKWDLHHHWAGALMEEFFKQGAMEAELGLPISPLCDRKTTNIAESQIAFIDVIVKPVFDLLFEVVEKIVVPILQKAASSREPCRKSGGTNQAHNIRSRSSLLDERGPCTEINALSTMTIPKFKTSVMMNIRANRDKWKDTLEPKKNESPEKESNRAKDHISEDKAHKEKSLKRTHSGTVYPKSKRYCTIPQTTTTSCACQLCDCKALEPPDVNSLVNAISLEIVLPRKDSDAMEVTASHESPQKESKRAKDHSSEDKAHKEKSPKRTNSETALSKSKKYCTVPQTPTPRACQLCDCKDYEPKDASCKVCKESSAEAVLPQQDSDSMEVTESYEEIVDHESSWRKARTVESNIKEMRALVPKTKPLSPNESDDVIIEEFIPEDPQPQPTRTSGPPATCGQEYALNSPNVGFIMTDLTQSDMEIFSLWNEEIMRQAAQQQKQCQSRMPPDAPLQVAVPVTEPTDFQGCEGASVGKPPQTFILQVISFDSPSVTYSNNGVLNCDVGPQAVPCEPTNDSIVPANTPQQNQMDPGGAAAVSLTSLNYGVFNMPQ